MLCSLRQIIFFLLLYCFQTDEDIVRSNALYRMVPFSMTLTDSGFQGHGIFEVKYLKGLVGRQEIKCRTVGSEAPSDDTFNELGYVRQVR